MSKTERTRLTITWSKETDLALRDHLRARGIGKRGLSSFVEDAVKWRLFDQTLAEVRHSFANVPADTLIKMIDAGVAKARKEKRR